MKKHWVFIWLCFLSLLAQAQADSSVRKDSAPPKSAAIVRVDTTKADTVKRAVDSIPVIPVKKQPSFLLDSHIYNHQLYYKFTEPLRQIAEVRKWDGKEPFFYITVGLLIFFALVRNGFGRYSQDLFGMFFRTSLKQRQIKEQLMQAPLPSLLLNILFLLSGALFINLVLSYFGLGDGYNFWLLFLYCLAGLTIIYLIKFITLKICGWIFHLSEATDAYTFIVFTTNKILGVLLLPFIILLSFTSGTAQQASFTLSLIAIGGLLVYRYYLSYSSIHRQVRINIFHFLLYLAAFEVAPLLLINKVLFMFLGKNS